jgi:hypothetical protein
MDKHSNPNLAEAWADVSAPVNISAKTILKTTTDSTEPSQLSWHTRCEDHKDVLMTA